MGTLIVREIGINWGEFLARRDTVYAEADEEEMNTREAEPGKAET